jgi:hypothetical protein
MSSTETVEGFPRWLAPSIDVKEGRDPLGLQTTTQDRLTPRLLPGILELSRRARYLSFHAYLLSRYRSLGLRATNEDLSRFVKRREWDYGLAVLLCPHDCGSIPVGAIALREEMARSDGPYARGESVISSLGGYGLYYRSPMADLGLVARAGTLLGDSPLPIDVLYDHPRAQTLAGAFGAAVADTEYVRTLMLTDDPLPVDVLVEYARVGCLCQLDAHPDERDAVFEAFFGDDPFGAAEVVFSSPADPSDDATASSSDALEQLALQQLGLSRSAAIAQRRRSVAHYLTVLDHEPDAASSASAYRNGLWTVPTRNELHAKIAGEWAGLVAKDVWQDALCSIWAEFCTRGLAASRERGGLNLAETREVTASLLAGPPALNAERTARQLLDDLIDGGVTLPGLDCAVTDASLEHLRIATVQVNTAASGLVVLLELHRRTADRSDPGWLATTRVRSAWQPSLLTVLDSLTTKMQTDVTIEDTLWWLVDTFIIKVHERIAYSKLQQREHTFRFRWEDGRYHFYDNGVGRFPLAAIRNEPLASLTQDVGFWEPDDDGIARLSDRGRSFIQEVLG